MPLHHLTATVFGAGTKNGVVMHPIEDILSRCIGQFFLLIVEPIEASIVEALDTTLRIVLRLQRILWIEKHFVGFRFHTYLGFGNTDGLKLTLTRQ